MTNDEDLWSDEICALVDAAFETVSRNPSDHEEAIAYRRAIAVAMRQTTQSDALREALWAMPEPYEYLNKDQLKSIRPYIDALQNWKFRFRAAMQEQSK